MTLLISSALYACDSDGKLNEDKLNSAGDKLQKTVEKGADSLKTKFNRLKDSLDRRDTTIRHDTIIQ